MHLWDVNWKPSKYASNRLSHYASHCLGIFDYAEVYDTGLIFKFNAASLLEKS